MDRWSAILTIIPIAIFAVNGIINVMAVNDGFGHEATPDVSELLRDVVAFFHHAFLFMLNSSPSVFLQINIFN